MEIYTTRYIVDDPDRIDWRAAADVVRQMTITGDDNEPLLEYLQGYMSYAPDMQRGQRQEQLGEMCRKELFYSPVPSAAFPQLLAEEWQSDNIDETVQNRVLNDLDQVKEWIVSPHRFPAVTCPSHGFDARLVQTGVGLVITTEYEDQDNGMWTYADYQRIFRSVCATMERVNSLGEEMTDMLWQTTED